MNETLTQHLTKCLGRTTLPYPKYSGKVRDIYDLGSRMLMVATDRVSAFDRPITTIPYKGQVINQISAWWFRVSRHIIKNHLVEIPEPYTMLVHQCQPIPIEVVVRGYLTGSTQTAIWPYYQSGQREFFNQVLPDGMQKDESLPSPIITPTSKSTKRDKPLSPNEILEASGLTEKQWQWLAKKALALFELGQFMAKQRGLILVDTKYEFGTDASGEIRLIDELHTPDSSRYWPQKHVHEHYDKEILRQWYQAHSLPYQQAVLPEAPDSLRVKMAARYIDLYERLTGEQFNACHFNPKALQAYQ